MGKKILALVLALTMCLGMTMSVSAAPKTTESSETQFTTKASKEELAVLKKMFNAKEYAAMYPDLKKAFGDDEVALWTHFVNYGLSEGRQLSKSFNVFAYRAAYKDLQKAFGSDLVDYYLHYYNYGMKEKRAITTLAKATKAGITVSGLKGEVLAKPVPIEVKASATVTPSASTSATPSASATPTPSASAKPSATPTPTPSTKPSGSEVKPSPAPCAHDGGFTYTVSENKGKHFRTCSLCKKSEEVACTFEDTGLCKFCGRKCEHNFDGMKQIDGTTTHGPLCTICGYVDTENAAACKADHCDSVNDTIHNEICKECGGVIKSEEHQYKYTNETAKDGTLIHKGTCDTCGNAMEGSCEFNEGSNICKICKYQHTTHQWDPNTGHCKFCGATCEHSSWDANTGKCQTCGKQCEHDFEDWQKVDESSHERSCKVCKYKETEGHDWKTDESGVTCSKCGAAQ